MRKIKILVVDDHQLILDGVRSLLERERDIEIVKEFKSPEKVIDFIRSGPLPNVVLMDVNMPTISGIELCEKITKEFPNIQVLALSIHERPQHIKRMVDAGASGFLLKKVERQELAEAIRTVAAGDNYFSKETTEILLKINTRGQTVKETHRLMNQDLLTTREREIIKKISEGLTSSEIADSLTISIHTVETHRRNIHLKLGIKNSAGLMKYAVEHELLKKGEIDADK